MGNEVFQKGTLGYDAIALGFVSIIPGESGVEGRPPNPWVGGGLFADHGGPSPFCFRILCSVRLDEGSDELLSGAVSLEAPLHMEAPRVSPFRGLWSARVSRVGDGHKIASFLIENTGNHTHIICLLVYNIQVRRRIITIRLQIRESRNFHFLLG